ncbi:MAG: MFS transporter [Chlamydiae bacterium CG10_big_fil_rev_8_21_14_0_10_35_9]|nr:MAG: MFS transporter [Chlamydiae bacterium CG10_big_fil_rev_8_21_14_0_10_35_9]
MKFYNSSVDHYHHKTKWAVILTNMLNEPLFTLYNLTAFILCKDLGATAFQIAILTMLRPTVSLLSLYWSANLHERSDKLKSNLLGAGFLSRLLFLFFPLYENAWFVIIAAAVYLMFYRAGIPAWMEILKLNLSKNSREKIFSWGSAIGFLEGSLLAIGFGRMLDGSSGSWKSLFFFSAIAGMINLFYLARIPINHSETTLPKKAKGSFLFQVIKPWRESFHLIRKEKQFSIFQWGFMISGIGIMMIQPALPLFFKDTLQLTYTDIAIALSIYKSLGFVISSPIWGRLLNRFWINQISSWVFILTGLFSIFMLFSPISRFWLYFSYFLYGIAQGGSHLIWNLSGPIFSGNDHSAKYSRVNIVMVGIRGAFAPLIGGAMCVALTPFSVLITGGGLCLYSGYWMLKQRALKSSVS